MKTGARKKQKKEKKIERQNSTEKVKLNMNRS